MLWSTLRFGSTMSTACCTDWASSFFAFLDFFLLIFFLDFVVGLYDSLSE